MALTGIGLSGFVLVHMSENLLLFAGPEAYNRYSNFLITNPLLPVAEIGLLLLFVIHVWLAIQLSVENGRARPVRPYQLPTSEGRRALFASRTMIYTGLLVFVFIVLHLFTFKWGTHYTATYGGVEMRDLYRLVVEKLKQPLYLAWYLFSMIVLGLHLSHGASGLIQSLGFTSAKRTAIRNLGWAFALVVAGGFFAEPIYIYLAGGR